MGFAVFISRHRGLERDSASWEGPGSTQHQRKAPSDPRWTFLRPALLHGGSTAWNNFLRKTRPSLYLKQQQSGLF